MSSRIYIGTRTGGAIIELPERFFDSLLDFAFEQGEIDGIDYMERLSPFRYPISGPRFEADTFDEWANAKGYSRAEMLAAFELWIDLLDQHGRQWEKDSDWRNVGRTSAELREMFEYGVRTLRKYKGREPLFSWVV